MPITFPRLLLNPDCMSSSSTLSRPVECSNPRHPRLAYISFFLVQTFDCFLFITLSSPPPAFDRSINTHWSHSIFGFEPMLQLCSCLSTLVRCNAIGKRVAWTFTLFHRLFIVPGLDIAIRPMIFRVILGERGVSWDMVCKWHSSNNEILGR